MARRNHQNTQNGKPYCVEWPEWYVDCAYKGCEESIFVAPGGAILIAKEAEKRLRDGKAEDSMIGWQNIEGL